MTYDRFVEYGSRNQPPATSLLNGLDFGPFVEALARFAKALQRVKLMPNGSIRLRTGPPPLRIDGHAYRRRTRARRRRR